MANTAKTRPIRFDQFKKQLDEAGMNNMQEVQLDKDTSIWIRLGNGIDSDDAKDFEARLAGALDSKEVALTVLDYYPERSAEEQWELFEAAGGTADTLAALWTAATVDQRERLGKLRPRRS